MRTRSGEVREKRRSLVELSGASPFARLAVAHALGLAGDVFLTVALSGSLFFKVSPADARPKLMLYLLLTMAPFAVVAPVLGPALDRVRGGKRLAFALSCGGRAVAVWLMASQLKSPALYPIAFAALVLSKAQAVTKAALVPSVVDGERTLVQANSRLALIGVVVGVIGALPAVMVLKTVDAPWVLRFGAVVYAAGFVFALRVPRPEPVAAASVAAGNEQAGAGRIRLASTAMMVLRGGVGYSTFLLAFVLRRADAPAWRYGAALGLSALGSAIGNALAPLVRRRLGEHAILVGSLLFPAVVAFFGARESGDLMPLAVAFSIGAGGAAGKIAFDSLVQRDAPGATQGRAFARFETRFQLAWVVGALLPVLFQFRTRFGLFVLALGLGFSGLSYFGGLRRTRPPRRGESSRGGSVHDLEAGEPQAGSVEF